MPEPYDSTWIDLFQTLPDPRHRRGCRFPWWVLLTVIIMALASNQHQPKAMSEWIDEHAELLRRHVCPLPVPHLRRVLRMVDVADLQDRLRHRAEPAGRRMDQGAALAWMHPIRSAGRHATRCCGGRGGAGSGIVLWQQAVERKSNQIPLAIAAHPPHVDRLPLRWMPPAIAPPLIRAGVLPDDLKTSAICINSE